MVFESQLFYKEVNEVKYVFRVLTMQDSVFIYIGPAKNENFDAFALAMQTTNGEISKTTILESGDSTAEDLAQKVSKKLKKPVFLSCHGIEDRLVVQPELTNFLFTHVCPVIS